MLIVPGAAGALAIGGLVGGLLRTRRRRRSTGARSLDSHRVEVQAGWTNMHGS